MIKQGKQQLKSDEKYRRYPYRCTADKLTIGFGHNIEDNGISMAVAEFILDEDIKECEGTLKRNIRAWDDLNEARQSVLINMCFNLGWPRLSKFKRMLAAVDAGDFDKAGLEMMDSKWAKQVGRRADDLRDIMIKGDFK